MAHGIARRSNRHPVPIVKLIKCHPQMISRILARCNLGQTDLPSSILSVRQSETCPKGSTRSFRILKSHRQLFPATESQVLDGTRSCWEVQQQKPPLRIQPSQLEFVNNANPNGVLRISAVALQTAGRAAKTRIHRDGRGSGGVAESSQSRFGRSTS